MANNEDLTTSDSPEATDNRENSPNTDGDYERRVRDKLRKAILLKDYAINNNLDVPDEVIIELNRAEATEDPSRTATDIDIAVRDPRPSHQIDD